MASISIMFKKILIFYFLTKVSMKKKSLILIFMLGTAILVLTACGGGPRQPYMAELDAIERAVMEAERAARDLPTVRTPEPTRAPSEATPADWDETMRAAEEWAEWGAGWASQYELREYEELRSLSLPRTFPAFLNYADGKVSSVRDTSSDTRTNISVEIRTPDDFDDVRDFYVDQMEKANWKIESQSARADSHSIVATNENERVNISVSGDRYSALVNISISYSDRL